MAWQRQRCLSYASDDTANKYLVDKAKLPSSWCHLPRTCQSCDTVFLQHMLLITLLG